MVNGDKECNIINIKADSGPKITSGKVKKATHIWQSMKAVGPDGIPTEVLKL